MTAPECPAWADGTRPAERPLPDARRWSGLAVLCLSLFVLALDNTKLVVALPLLGKVFADEPGALRWLPEAYLFVYACLLALGGLLSERFGARRTLLTGGVLFGVASAAAALSSTGLALLLSRAVMGAAGALMTPATLATIRHTFDEQERPRAVALWTASFGVGSALGPVLAGALLDGFSWRSIFWINLPVALVIVTGTLLRVSPHLPRRAVPLDAVGTLLALLTTGLTLFVILEGPALGSGRPELWLSVGGAVAAGFAFLRWERRAPHPLFDLELFGSARFRVALGVIVLTYLAFAGVTFVMAQYLQLGRGYDPLRAGNLTVPVALAMLLGTLCAPLATARLGSRGALLCGVSVAFVGFVLLGVATHLEHDLVLGVAQVPLGLGSGVAFATATDMVVSSGTAERAGSAAALNETAFELGGVLGIALLSRVLAAGAAGRAQSLGASTTAAVGLGALAVGLAIALTLRLSSDSRESDGSREP